VTRPGGALLVVLSLAGAALSVVGFARLASDAPRPPPPVVEPAKPTPPPPKRPPSARQVVDGKTGLILDDGWELVAQQCTGCHSSRLVTQNAGDREHWETMIRWMQRTQNLWRFEPDVEASILDYLAKNYGPRSFGRRAPLDPWLLPVDPNRTVGKAPASPSR